MPTHKPLMNVADVGRRIALLRELAGIGSQRELARRLGVTHHTVGAWEHGRSYPLAGDFPGLREHLKTSLDFLFFGEIEGLPRETLLRLVHRDPPSAAIRDEIRRTETDKPVSRQPAVRSGF